MKTIELLEGIEASAEARSRREKPWLFDDEDCCKEKSRLQEYTEKQDALHTIQDVGVPKDSAKKVLDLYMKNMADRMGFGRAAERAFKSIEKKIGTFIDWDGVWERLAEIYESKEA